MISHDLNVPVLFSALGAMAVVRRCRVDCRNVESRDSLDVFRLMKTLRLNVWVT